MKSKAYGKYNDLKPTTDYRCVCQISTQAFSYIYYKINNREEAEDLVQETFLRLMDYKGLLCEETVRSFVMTIALNLVTDYLRRHYKKQEITTYLYDMLPVSYTHVGSSVITSDLQQQEVKRMTLMPVQRKKIYYLNRFEGKTAKKSLKSWVCLSARLRITCISVAKKCANISENAYNYL